jgi:alpha-mannosidase
MKFSLEHQNPLATGMITGTANAKTSNSFSLLSVSNTNVLLWSVKPSEEGITNGLITRFWNVGGVAARPVLKLSQPINKAWKTSHLETNEKAMPPSQKSLQLRFMPNQINSYRIVL